MEPNQQLESVKLLSDQQKQLLRLVHRGVTSSKLLARSTDLQPSSIKAYLYRAARILGTDSRTEAAARFVAIENALAAEPAAPIPPDLNGRSTGGYTATGLVKSLISAIHGLAGIAKSFFTGLPVGGKEHTSPWWIVVLQILRVAIIGMFGLTAVVLFVFGFLWTFSKVP